MRWEGRGRWGVTHSDGKLDAGLDLVYQGAVPARMGASVCVCVGGSSKVWGPCLRKTAHADVISEGRIRSGPLAVFSADKECCMTFSPWAFGYRAGLLPDLAVSA